MGEIFEFAEEVEIEEESSTGVWKILVVDDEKSVHDVTISALRNVVIEGKKLEVLSALSASEAKVLLDEHTDIAIALVDVIMETATAGLDLVDYIRKELKNDKIRLVIRTGQPDEVPEREIINQYDINDYKEKTELTVDKLYTIIRSSIKQYMQLIELANKYEDVYTQMTTHPLTKLPNRQKLNEVLDSTGDKSLVLINIDGFSVINETQGFDIGDELLKQMGGFLHGMYSEEMEVFHLEGDIFGILNLDSKIDEKKLFDIQKEINFMSFLLGGIENRLSVTLGLVMHEEGNLIQKAEFALKDARSIGPNRASKYSDDIKIIKTIHHNSLWSQRVRDALENGRILTYYQPIFSTKTLEIEKYECLVRLDFEGEIVAPFNFLDAAKHSGQLYKIFRIMFENACKKTKEFSGQFTINMTDKDLEEPDLLEFIDEIMQKYDVNPKQIGIEILEEKSIMNNSLIKDRLHVLNKKGMSIIIDDFGAECSNFGQLVNLPISVLKIDGMFVKDLPTNPQHRIITESIVDFSKKIHTPTVAEFVHSAEVLEIVKEIGIEYAQGFHLGEPKPDLVR